MEMEYGVKTANKFLISEFTGVDDDDVVEDPSDILQRLAAASSLKDEKSSATNLKNKKQLAAAAAHKKLAAAGAANIIPALGGVRSGKQTAVVAQNKFSQADGRPRFDRNAYNKENDMTNDNARDATGPRRFFRGGANQQGRAGIARTRLPRQERTDLPPRFRGGPENDQEFAQDKPNFDSQMESNNLPDNNIRQPAGFGSGFEKSTTWTEDSDINNVEGNNRRQFNNRPNNRGFGGRGRFNNNNNAEGGGGGFGGGFNNNRGAGGNFRPRNRPLDRQSGSNKTGVKAVDKRDGAGAHNWGSALEDANSAAAGEGGPGADDSFLGGQQPQADSGVADADNKQSSEMDVSAPTSGEEAPRDNGPQENVEQEPVQLTLDEYKALQAPKSAPQFNVRRPGEGEKNPAWELLKPLKGGRADESSKKKKQHEAEEEDEEDEYEIIHEGPKILPIDIRFIGEPARRPRGGGGGRGGRGGGPGRGGFGGAGGGGGSGFGGGQSREFGGSNRERDSAGRKQESTTPYKIDDESFPSLS